MIKEKQSVRAIRIGLFENYAKHMKHAFAGCSGSCLVTTHVQQEMQKHEKPPKTHLR